MSPEYGYFVRELVGSDCFSTGTWDALLAAYSSAQRAVALWGQCAHIPVRLLAIHKEYDYQPCELPPAEMVFSDELDEAEFAECMLDRLERMTGKSINCMSLAVDVTAFMRPELICLVVGLKRRGAVKVDFFYSEPVRYRSKGWTTFSSGVSEVRQVRGCEGLHDPMVPEELLVIGTGYDDVLMRLVALEKPRASKALVLGFPSLAPDMYQENVWRVSRTEEELGGDRSLLDELLAPASDPFETATIISEYISRIRDQKGHVNVYLSPLGTKPQVLGFALYFAMECLDAHTATSMLLPISTHYERITGDRVSRTWRYQVEFK